MTDACGAITHMAAHDCSLFSGLVHPEALAKHPDQECDMHVRIARHGPGLGAAEASHNALRVF